MKKVFAVFTLLTATLVSGPALAATLTVTTTADGGAGSLRDAINGAASGDTIVFNVSGTITLTSGELEVDKNLVIVGPGAANLTIQRSTAGGTPDFRVFNLQPPGIITISGLTVSNGRADFGGGIANFTSAALYDCILSGNSTTNSGGGLYNFSSLVMSNCVLSGNSVAGSSTSSAAAGGGVDNPGTLAAVRCQVIGNTVGGMAGQSGVGGGINNDGTLALTNSVIVSNTATAGGATTTGSGGGIYNEGTLTMDTSTVGANVASGGSGGLGQGGGINNDLGSTAVVRSTISGNAVVLSSPGSGGGLFNNAGTVTLENSTVSGNDGLSSGGGIFNGQGSLALNHSTVTTNVAAQGGLFAGNGLYNGDGVVDVHDTIIGGNGTASDVFNNATATFRSGGYNLFGPISGPITPGANDQFNVTTSQLLLGPLQDNGGPTFTHAGLCGSLAINAGDNTGAPPPDQRGFPRIVGGTIDIGAYEYSNSPPTVSCPSSSTNCIPGGQVVAMTFTVNVGDADGDPLVVVWSLDGSPYQTNIVGAAGPPTVAQVDFQPSLVVGTHQIAATVSDPSGCAASCSTTVVLNPNPTVTAGNNGPVCAGLTLNLTAISPTAVSFSWTGPNGFTSSIQNPTIPNATPAASGLYSVTVTDTNGCTASATTIATVGTGPTVTAGNNGPICAGATLRLTATSPTGTSFSWTGPNGFSSTLQNPAISNVTAAAGGLYTVTTSDTNGCIGSATTLVTVGVGPSVTAGNDGPLCAGATLHLSASGPTAASFSWTGPNGFTSPLQNPAISNVAASASGVYTVTVVDTNGCLASATTVAVVNPRPAVAAANNGPLCSGATLNLTATSPTAVSFSWTGPNGFTSTLQNPIISNVTAAASGAYVVTIADANGCTASAGTMVTVLTGVGNLYPIALSQKTLTNVAIGATLPDIYNGVQPGNFGWLTWAGSPSEPTLVTSLTPPGNSSTYINPSNKNDHVVSVGDWVRGKPGVSNSDKVRKALDALEKIDITVPVWDKATKSGNNSLYHVVGFARVRIINYRLPNQNRITARYLGPAGCQ